MKTIKTKKFQFFELMENGKTQDECEKILGLSHGVAKVYSCQFRRKKKTGNHLKPYVHKDRLESSPIEQPYVGSTSGTDTTSDNQLIPQRDGYYPRKLVKGITDIKVLENFYNIRAPVLIIGDTGTGKTHAVRHFCFERKLPYKRINLNGGTTAEDLIGQYVPDGTGKFKWVDGWLTKFARDGGVICLDEVNGCPAEILFALHSITDDERIITLTAKDGETIHAHKDLWVVATMNPDYEDTKTLNAAFKDRFRVLEWDYDSKVEKKLNIPDGMIEMASSLRELYRKGEISTPISTRALLYYVEDARLMGEKAACELFLNRFTVDDRIAIEEVMKLKEKDNKVDEGR